MAKASCSAGCGALAPDRPIVAALDLHANLSEAMVTLSDALVAYRTYPHIDLAVTGGRCLPLLERLMAAPLAKAWRRIDFLVPLPWQCTTSSPGPRIYAPIDESRRKTPSASICMGFPPADTPGLRPGGRGLRRADQPAPETAATAWREAFEAAEPHFAGRLWRPTRPSSSCRCAATGGRPIILADTQDNPGGGGTARYHRPSAALIAARAEGALLALLCDPETAAAHTPPARGRSYAGSRSAGAMARRVSPRYRGIERSPTRATAGSPPPGRCMAATAWISGRWPCSSACAAPGVEIAVSYAPACRPPTGQFWSIWAWIQSAETDSGTEELGAFSGRLRVAGRRGADRGRTRREHGRSGAAAISASAGRSAGGPRHFIARYA